jgi:4-hydroxy-tetrahydrodipicolinate synthase
MKDRDEIRQLLTCPVASMPTTFNRDGSIDFDGLRNFIDFTIAGGTTTILLTYGDSLYTSLTDREVEEVTRVAVEHTAGRALVVAADRIWATPREVEFARHVREIGADVLMVLPPDWAQSCTLDTFVEHYAAVANEIPVMVVTNLFMQRQQLGLSVLQRLAGEVPNVVAVKDDVCGVFARKMALAVHDRIAIISGGQKQNHLDIVPYGVDGYLSTFIKFKPAISQAYWQSVQAGEWDRVRDIVKTYDIPYFDFIMGLQGGFNAGLHGTLELFGVAQRWRRKPYYSLNDEEMERLAGFFREKRLL